MTAPSRSSADLNDGSWERFEALGFERISEHVVSAQDMFRDNAGLKDVFQALSMKLAESSFVDLVMDMARTRRRASEKFSGGEHMFFTSEGLRWATPEPAAVHCAKRLAREQIMDLTCGQGGQTVFLARECLRLVAVDIDPLNCLMTRLNLWSMGLENASVVRGSCLSEGISRMAEPGCAIFCDPARPPGSPERTLGELVPDPASVLERYGPLVSGACFELPPYIGLDKVPFGIEAEYVSIDGRLNRLNIYTGDLKRSPRSAVILPGGSTIRGEPVDIPPKNPTEGQTLPKYLFEIDPALMRAGLVHHLLQDIGASDDMVSYDGRRTLLFSDRPLSSPFIIRGYEVLGTCTGEEGLRELMVSKGVSKVTLRWAIEPRDYWKRRTSLEDGLEGGIKAHLFKTDRFVLAKALLGGDEE